MKNNCVAVFERRNMVVGTRVFLLPRGGGWGGERVYLRYLQYQKPVLKVHHGGDFLVQVLHVSNP